TAIAAEALADLAQTEAPPAACAGSGRLTAQPVSSPART
ncbi:unnamed protein product, partial [Ectocarpus sp. 6 AP-2014]